MEKRRYSVEEMLRSNREAHQRWLRPFKNREPTPPPHWIELVGFLLLNFLARCILVGLPIYIGCCASLFVMALFSSHGDALFRIGLPAAQKAFLYLSPVGGLIWSAVSVYLLFRRQGAEDESDESDESKESEEFEE